MGLTFYSVEYPKRIHFPKMVDEAWCRSPLEQMIYQRWEKDDDVLRYEVEPLRIPYTLDGKTHHYIPDALVHTKDGARKLVEIKVSGEMETEKNRRKFEAARKHCGKGVWTFEIQGVEGTPVRKRQPASWQESPENIRRLQPARNEKTYEDYLKNARKMAEVNKTGKDIFLALDSLSDQNPLSLEEENRLKQLQSYSALLIRKAHILTRHINEDAARLMQQELLYLIKVIENQYPSLTFTIDSQRSLFSFIKKARYLKGQNPLHEKSFLQAYVEKYECETRVLLASLRKGYRKMNQKENNQSNKMEMLTHLQEANPKIRRYAQQLILGIDNQTLTTITRWVKSVREKNSPLTLDMETAIKNKYIIIKNEHFTVYSDYRTYCYSTGYPFLHINSKSKYGEATIEFPTSFNQGHGTPVDQIIEEIESGLEMLNEVWAINHNGISKIKYTIQLENLEENTDYLLPLLEKIYHHGFL